jgi:CHAD domain-containing protein
MPYRIRPDRDLDKEVRRIAATQLQLAIDVLEQRPQGLHEAIHEARKKFKRLRNLYRLMASTARSFRQSENIRLRDAARSLAHVRNATALIETVQHLSSYALSDDEAETLTAARAVLTLRRDELATAETDLEDKVKHVIADCRDALVPLKTLDIPSKTTHAARMLGRAWHKGLERGREALEACKSEGHGEAFHDLRKAGQAYWMNLSLLLELWPSAFATKREQAKALVDLLGHEHDLTELTALLDREPETFGDGEGQSFLLAIIIRRQQALRRESLDLAARVFADDPRREGAIIEQLWIEAGHAAKRGWR